MVQATHHANRHITTCNKQQQHQQLNKREERKIKLKYVNKTQCNNFNKIHQGKGRKQAMAREKIMTETIMPATQNTSGSPSKTEKHIWNAHRWNKCMNERMNGAWKDSQLEKKKSHTIFNLFLEMYSTVCVFNVQATHLCVLVMVLHIVTAAAAVCHFVTCHFYIWKKLCLFLSIYLHILNVQEREITYTHKKHTKREVLKNKFYTCGIL